MKRAITDKNWTSYLAAYEDGLISECQAMALFQFIMNNESLQTIEGHNKELVQEIVSSGLVGKIELRPRKFL